MHTQLVSNFFAAQTLMQAMPLLSRKGLLAIATVIDVALHAQGRPISAKTLASRHGLPPRHLESVLQALVRERILIGTRGPRGGYGLARERRQVTANDILRAADSVDESDIKHADSELLIKVVLPAVSAAEKQFGIALGRINLEEMARSAEALKS
jgi:Rrf2 family iron-sulfur cluster assembly transcriptional regulator